MHNTPDSIVCESENPSPLLPNQPPRYSKCLSCPDFVTACRGIDITFLSGSEEKRAYHKAIKKFYGFLLKDIYPLVKNVIGKSTTDEYFGSGSGDYKWTTVTTIHNALLYLVAQKKGVPLCEHSCSSYSSEVRQQLAAAEQRAAQAESYAASLQETIVENNTKHIDQIAHLEAMHAQSDANYAKDIEWFKNDVLFWRRLVFILIAIGLVLLGLVVFYFCIDATHPTSGIIRY